MTIDYYLRDGAEKVDPRDPGRRRAGRPVVHRDRRRAEKQEETPAEDEPRQAEPTVSVKKGMNRFVWDMRYEGPSTFPKMILWAAGPRGPRAVPGSYSVRLSAGGVTQTQPFQVLAHPLLKNVSEGDLREQFRLASQIRDRVSQANEAVVRIRSAEGADRGAP